MTCFNEDHQHAFVIGKLPSNWKWPSGTPYNTWMQSLVWGCWILFLRVHGRNGSLKKTAIHLWTRWRSMGLWCEDRVCQL